MASASNTDHPPFTTKQELINEVRRVVEPTNPGEMYSLLMRIAYTDLATITLKDTVTPATFGL
jgi:hypothetical protein